MGEGDIEGKVRERVQLVVALGGKRPVECQRDFVPSLQVTADDDACLAIGLARGEFRLSVRHSGNGPSERDAGEQNFHLYIYSRKPFSVPERLPSSLRVPGFQFRAMSRSAATLSVKAVMSTKPTRL